MKKTISTFLGLCLLLSLLMTACQPTPKGAWADFMKCANNACVKEVVAVKDDFLKDPKPLFEEFVKTDERGEDHFIGWLYILRDSVLLNSSYGTTEDRFAMQQAILAAAKPYESDAKYGGFAKSIVSEVEVLAIASELEDDVQEAYAPITGTYVFELPNEAGSGELKVSVADGESIRFGLEVVAGPPAHNQGTMEGTAKLTAMNVYEFSTSEYSGTCKLQFTFQGGAVEIKTLDGDPGACGFGNGVMADNVYRMKSLDDPYLSPADAKVVKNLQGQWVSTEDAKSEVHIENGLYSDVYDGEEVGSFPYQYHAKCPKDCNPSAEMPCLSVLGQDVVCYAVVSADGKTLQLSMIGGRGNTLSFKKK